MSVGRRLSWLGLSLWGLCLLASPVGAANLGVGLEPVAGLTDIPSPVAMAHAGDSRLFVVLKGGQIRVFDGTATTTFLDISGLVSTTGERGLLGHAFHPDYASNGFFFVYYSNTDGDEVIARYSVSGDPDVADATSEQILLTIPHPGQSNHNGGALAFGPDGYLYAAVGDGGGAGDTGNHAQDKSLLLGKILRLDVDVAAPYVPATNPFLESPVDDPATRAEIWAYGLRNPWRIAFDRDTGDLFIADVGQGAREEIDFQPATGPTGSEFGGRNYGWRCKEGFADFNNTPACSEPLVPPILDYAHGPGGGCAVIGGYRYRGPQISSLQGVYVFGDFCSGTIWGGVEGSPWSKVVLVASGLSISTFGEDVDGELYVADLGGVVYRIRPPRASVTLAGPGTGSVSGPDGMDCPGVCTVAYEPGSPVSLAAAAAPDSLFAGWSGACGDPVSCDLTMDGDKAVTATFDRRPFLEFGAAGYTVGEGGTATINVERFVSTAGTVTVDYTVLPGSATSPPGPDADYGIPPTGLTGTLTFASGQGSGTFAIPTIGDTRAEGPETILLALSNPTGGALLGAQRTAVLTIQDNDTGGSLQFEKRAYTVNEGAGTLMVKVRRSGGSASGVSVDVEVTDGPPTGGSDYTLPSTPLILPFGAGQTSQSFNLTILNPGIDPTDAEADETMQLTLQNPTGGATLGSQKTTLVTIVDNDRIGTFQLAKAAYAVAESNGTVPLVVTRSGPTAAPASVELVFVDGTAVGGGACNPGVDYSPTPPPVSFAAGTSSQTVNVPICVDTVSEPTPETFTARLQNPSAGYALGSVKKEAPVTIADDRVQFSATEYFVSEGSGSVALTLLRPAWTPGPLTVDYAASSTGGPGLATAAPTPTTCAGSADFRPVAGSVTFGAGQTSKTVSIPLCPDSVVEGDEIFTVDLTGPSTAVGNPASAGVRIQENDGTFVRLSASSYTVSEDSTSFKVRVSRSGPSGSSFSVDLVSGDMIATASGDCSGGGDYVTVNQHVDFAPGGPSSQMVPITLCPDSVAKGNKTFRLELQNAPVGIGLGNPNKATVTLTDNEKGGTIEFAASAVSAGEDQDQVTLVVTRTGGSASEVTADWEVVGGTAVEGDDYTGDTSGTLTFALGQSQPTVPLAITLLNHAATQGPRSLVIKLQSAGGGGTLGAKTTVTLWILDAAS